MQGEVPKVGDTVSRDARRRKGEDQGGRGEGAGVLLQGSRERRHHADEV